MANNIEVELRSVVPFEEVERVRLYLEEQGTLVSKTHRLMVMFFGRSGESDVDIRIRITNGKAEMVVKRGDLHGHNRVEESQAITRDQLVGLARIVSLLGYDSKVGERESYNYDLGNGVTASLVVAGQIAYLEYEKMSTSERAEEEKVALEERMLHVGLPIIKTREEFYALGQRLTDEVDWKFSGSVVDCDRLEKQLQKV